MQQLNIISLTDALAIDTSIQLKLKLYINTYVKAHTHIHTQCACLPIDTLLYVCIGSCLVTMKSRVLELVITDILGASQISQHHTHCHYVITLNYVILYGNMGVGYPLLYTFGFILIKCS